MIPPSRRQFLRTLLALPIATTLDVERLLWVPSPIITVPALSTDLLFDEINRITLATIFPAVLEMYLQPSPLLRHLRTRGSR